MTTSSRTTALVYIRVSRLDRDDRERLREDGDDAKLRALSPATQLAHVKTLPALRGLTVEVFEDLHRSGKTLKRPGLERLRERAQVDDVAIVAVWSLSRLGRSVRDLFDLVDEFQAAGVGFVSAKENVDTTTPAGRAFFGILATLAQFEPPVRDGPLLVQRARGVAQRERPPTAERRRSPQQRPPSRRDLRR